MGKPKIITPVHPDLLDEATGVFAKMGFSPVVVTVAKRMPLAYWPEDVDLGDGTVDEESEWYAELNRGYNKDRI